MTDMIGADIIGELIEDLEYSLKEYLLEPWYPKAIDRVYGGFLTTFSHDFRPTGRQDKMIVTQARHTWVNSKAAGRYREVGHFAAGAHAGFLFLKDKMWDDEFGGFHSLVNRAGSLRKRDLGIKEAYGNAFGIFALAAYYKTFGDPAALDLARQAFMWLERNSHDPVNLGYYQHMNRAGYPICRTADVPSKNATGYKDQNSSIHLMEAFTELYKVWPDELLRERLREMVTLIRDKMVSPKGNLILFFHPDWKPVSFSDFDRAVILEHKVLDHVSFGHDVETAYLLIDAAQALGQQVDPKTIEISKRMVDHALKNGWDKDLGGFYNEGYYFKGDDRISLLLRTKNWWAQAEGLNTLLYMAYMFPADPMCYFEKFVTLWRYTDCYLIDHKFGDWYDEGLDASPERRTALKGQIWKGCYHNYRALVNCIDRMRMAQDSLVKSVI